MLKPHGVRGLLKVRLHNPASQALLSRQALSLVLLDGSRCQARLEEVGGAGDALIVRFEGVPDRAAAEPLVGARILVEREALDPLEPDQYYYEDLVGCRVVDERGRIVGTVHHVFEAGASDVIAVREGETELYLPWVDEWVTGVDLEAGEIRVRGIEQFERWRAER